MFAVGAMFGQEGIAAPSAALGACGCDRPASPEDARQCSIDAPARGARRASIRHHQALGRDGSFSDARTCQVPWRIQFDDAELQLQAGGECAGRSCILRSIVGTNNGLGRLACECAQEAVFSHGSEPFFGVNTAFPRFIFPITGSSGNCG